MCSFVHFLSLETQVAVLEKNQELHTKQYECTLGINQKPGSSEVTRSSTITFLLSLDYYNIFSLSWPGLWPLRYCSCPPAPAPSPQMLKTHSLEVSRTSRVYTDVRCWHHVLIVLDYNMVCLRTQWWGSHCSVSWHWQGRNSEVCLSGIFLPFSGI